MPPSDEEVEAAARAIARAFYTNNGEKTNDIADENWDLWIVEATAALTAAERVRQEAGMVSVPREPTEAMLATFHETVQITVYPDEKAASIMNDKDVWRAMLAAATGGQDE